MEPLLTESEAAEILGVTVRTLSEKRKGGYIRSYNLGYNTIRYNKEQIQEYLNDPFTIKINIEVPNEGA